MSSGASGLAGAGAAIALTTMANDATTLAACATPLYPGKNPQPRIASTFASITRCRQTNSRVLRQVYQSHSFETIVKIG